MAEFNMTVGIYLVPDGDTISCNELPLTTRAFFDLLFYDFQTESTLEFPSTSSRDVTEGYLYLIVLTIANVGSLVNISRYSFFIDGVEYPLGEDNLVTLNLEESSWADTDLRIFPNKCPIYTSNTVYTGAQVTGTTTTATSLTTYTDSYGMYVTETIYIVATPTEVPTSEETQSLSTQNVESSETENELTTSTEYLQSSSTSDEEPSLTEYVSSSTTDFVTTVISTIEESSSLFSTLDSSSIYLQESTSTFHSETIPTGSHVVTSTTSFESTSSIISEISYPESSVSSSFEIDDVSRSEEPTVVETSTEITYTETNDIDSTSTSDWGIETISSAISVPTSTYDPVMSGTGDYNTESTSMATTTTTTTTIEVDTGDSTVTDIGTITTSAAQSDISPPGELSTVDSFSTFQSYTSKTLYGSSIDAVSTETIVTEVTIVEPIPVQSSTMEAITGPTIIMDIVSSHNIHPTDIDSIHTVTVVVPPTTDSRDTTPEIVNTAVTSSIYNSEVQNNEETVIQPINSFSKSASKGPIGSSDPTNTKVTTFDNGISMFTSVTTGFSASQTYSTTSFSIQYNDSAEVFLSRTSFIAFAFYFIFFL